MTRDSLIGIPFQQPLDCDSCRVSLARSGVDSLRLGNMERGVFRGIGAGYLAIGVLAVLLYFSVDHD